MKPPILPPDYEATLQLDNVTIHRRATLLFSATQISMRRPSFWVYEGLTDDERATIVAFVKTIWHKDIANVL